MTRVAEDKKRLSRIFTALWRVLRDRGLAGGMDDMDANPAGEKESMLMQNTVPAGEGAMCACDGVGCVNIER